MVFIGGFTIARSLDVFAPLQPEPYATWWPAIITGGILLAIGIYICWSAVSFFRRHGTNLMPNTRASDLVMTGPFRYSRNPMYVALFLQYIGVALLTHSVWAFLLLPAVWAFVRFEVIGREEKYLTAEFGETYTNYKAQVRRWL